MSDIQIYIRQSQLSSEEKEHLLFLIEMLDDTQLAVLSDYFKKNIDAIPSFYSNIQKKYSALSSKDSDAWSAILAEEGSELLKLDFQE